MNKREVDRLLPLAYDVIEKGKFKDKKTGVIDAAYRGQISAYGAAIANGSLLAATAFFSKEGDQSKVNRGLLMKAINELLREGCLISSEQKKGTLFDTIRGIYGSSMAQHNVCREKVLLCATALKLAFNLFDLDNGEKKSDDGNEADAPSDANGQE